MPPHPLADPGGGATGGQFFGKFWKKIICLRPLLRVGAPSYENAGSAPAIIVYYGKTRLNNWTHVVRWRTQIQFSVWSRIHGNFLYTKTVHNRFFFLNGAECSLNAVKLGTPILNHWSIRVMVPSLYFGNVFFVNCMKMKEIRPRGGGVSIESLGCSNSMNCGPSKGKLPVICWRLV